jgi:peptide deformylase
MNKIKIIGEPVLREKSELITDIDEEIAKLAQDMGVIMQESNGIGLAAPQIGLSKRMFVTYAPNDKLRVFINPDIIMTSPETSAYEEGCLSIPGVYADVTRSSAVAIQAFNEKGKLFKLDADGILARVILHEYDHLQGKMFVDYLSEKKQQRILKKFRKK